MDKKILTAKRLSLALSNMNMIPQELSNASGVNKSSISQYLNGSHSPTNISSEKMAKILNVNPVWLMGFDVSMRNNDYTAKDQIKPKTINVLNRVAAGIPVNANTEIIDVEEISQEMVRTGEYFGLKIHDDSMEPRICDGDVVIVRQQDDAESGDIVIAMVNGDDATCKRLVKYASSIALVSLNSKYEPMMFTNEEIMSKPVRVIGKVVELRGKF